MESKAESKNAEDDTDLLEAQQAVQELFDETTEIRNGFKHSLHELNQQFRSIDVCFNKQRRQGKKYKQVSLLVTELKSSSIDVGKETESQLKSTKAMIDELGKSKRRLGSVFLRGIMGHVSVKLWNEGERVQFKQEYNRFKEAFMPVHLLIPLIQLYFGWSLVVHQIQAFFAFYYYTCLAIRENILAVNGSRIEPWWIYHHYVTLVSSLFFLLVSEKHPLVVHNVAWFCNVNLLWQAIVMLVQNNYQKKRHYTRKALAKKSEMDVKTTEVIDENPQSAGIYRFLIPALFATYAFQLFICLSNIYVIYYFGNEFESFDQYIQSWILVVCWFMLPSGNVVTLLKVLSRRNKRMYEISNMFSAKNRKAIGTQLFFIGTVAKSVGGQWFKVVAMYASHLFKSVRKFRSSKSSSKKHSSKKKSSSKDKGSKDKRKEKSSKDSSKSKDSSVVTTKKQQS